MAVGWSTVVIFGVLLAGYVYYLRGRRDSGLTELWLGPMVSSRHESDFGPHHDRRPLHALVFRRLRGGDDALCMSWSSLPRERPFIVRSDYKVRR